ncbi:hypothetical protein IAE35_12775 [Pseudomonas sp. S75]|uniref:hypothetical protein n=1 Tax=unclassified Pseudomonas TaxID=196821 RepID=UPI001906AAAF|nr:MULTISPECIES: hypothetical protein [unclassified Pseudomonas]MBJ9974476.1 hypothetical protein [Pseudomonas sp. S30]MBK0154215.1 hypothetical protein [Pseudomonas sp. S75]
MSSVRYGVVSYLLYTLACSHAQASAHLWPVELLPTHYESFTQCLAVLQQQDQDDHQGLATLEVLDSGATVKKTLQGPGLTHSGKDTASYQATVGWKTRLRVDDHMQANYTSETRDMRCDGPTLHSSPSGEAFPAMPESE